VEGNRQKTEKDSRSAMIETRIFADDCRQFKQAKMRSQG
jgi:hypothetical protein